MHVGLAYTMRTSASPAAIGDVDDRDEEFDSPETINALAEALHWLGHDVTLLGDGRELVERLLAGAQPELVFNIAEGLGVGRCREARVPALLEMLDIPYTGSDPLTLAATLDKDCAKRLVRCAGVPTPDWVLVDGPVDRFASRLAGVPLPAIVKPAFEGSSKGVLAASVLDDRDELIALISDWRERYRQPVLVEEFIEGDELTIGLLGNAPPSVLGVMRVLPLEPAADARFVYSLEVKRDWQRRVHYEVPARISPRDAAAVEHAALAAWQALGCRDIARIDFRLRHGVPYFLEANPLPGLSPASGDLVILARGMGIGHGELLDRILEAARLRCDQRTCVV